MIPKNLKSILEIRRIGVECSKEVQKLIASSYAPRAELTKAANVPLAQAVAVQTERARHLLQQNASIGVFEKQSETLVAVSLNLIRFRSEMSKIYKDEPFENEFKWRHQLIKTQTDLEGNILEELGAEKICSTHMLTVHTSYTHMGIGTSLIKRMVDLAADLGCDYAIAHVTSKYAMEILNKSGWCLLRSIDLMQYKNDNGTIYFVNAKTPNNLFSLMYRPLLKSV
ncbi:uncharacterized protein LOC144747592 [Ciona intestinalis]